MSKKVLVGLLALVAVVYSVQIYAFTVKPKDGTDFPRFSLTFTQGTVGTTAVAFPRECIKLHVKALAANSGNIYLGDSGVTADKGFELDGGEEVLIESYTYNEIYIIGSAVGQKYSYICYN